MKVHDTVALLADLPGQGLVRGQLGAIVEEWAPGVFEVEFCDLDGVAYAFAAVPADQLLPLVQRPMPKAS